MWKLNYKWEMLGIFNKKKKITYSIEYTFPKTPLGKYNSPQRRKHILLSNKH